LECLQSEKIESISSSGSKAEVITRRVFPLSENYYFIRYHLEARGDSWLISEVDLQCCPCDGKPGNTDCPRCQGTGWMNTNLLEKKTTAPSQKSDAEKVAA
jgi:TFIIF-interacting CTD phosphatase-like protein